MVGDWVCMEGTDEARVLPEHTRKGAENKQNSREERESPWNKPLFKLISIVAVWPPLSALALFQIPT